MEGPGVNTQTEEQPPQDPQPPPPPQPQSQPPEQERQHTSPEQEINSEKIENLVRAAKELCEDDTITLQEKRASSAKIIGNILVGSLKLLINTGRFIINGISFIWKKYLWLGDQ